MNSLTRYLLLQDWSNTTGVWGSRVFLLGKAIGMAGRVLGVLLVPVALVGAWASPTVLFFVGYGAGFALVLALAVELLARVLMMAGNAISSRGMRA